MDQTNINQNNNNNNIIQGGSNSMLPMDSNSMNSNFLQYFLNSDNNNIQNTNNNGNMTSEVTNSQKMNYMNNNEFMNNGECFIPIQQNISNTPTQNKSMQMNQNPSLFRNNNNFSTIPQYPVSVSNNSIWNGYQSVNNQMYSVNSMNINSNNSLYNNNSNNNNNDNDNNSNNNNDNNNQSYPVNMYMQSADISNTNSNSNSSSNINNTINDNNLNNRLNFSMNNNQNPSINNFNINNNLNRSINYNNDNNSNVINDVNNNPLAISNLSSNSGLSSNSNSSTFSLQNNIGGINSVIPNSQQSIQQSVQPTQQPMHLQKRATRASYSNELTAFMESKYSENKFPSAEEKMNISKITGLNESQVSSWFARQRKKEKEGKIEVKKDDKKGNDEFENNTLNSSIKMQPLQPQPQPQFQPLQPHSQPFQSKPLLQPQQPQIQSKPTISNSLFNLSQTSFQNGIMDMLSQINKPNDSSNTNININNNNSSNNNNNSSNNLAHNLANLLNQNTMSLQNTQPISMTNISNQLQQNQKPSSTITNSGSSQLNSFQQSQVLSSTAPLNSLSNSLQLQNPQIQSMNRVQQLNSMNLSPFQSLQMMGNNFNLNQLNNNASAITTNSGFMPSQMNQNIPLQNISLNQNSSSQLNTNASNASTFDKIDNNSVPSQPSGNKESKEKEKVKEKEKTKTKTTDSKSENSSTNNDEHKEIKPKETYETIISRVAINGSLNVNYLRDFVKLLKMEVIKDNNIKHKIQLLEILRKTRDNDVLTKFVNDTKGITYLAKWLSDEKKEESIVLPVLLKTLKRLPITLNVLKITKLGVVLKGFTNSNNKDVKLLANDLMTSWKKLILQKTSASKSSDKDKSIDKKQDKTQDKKTDKKSSIKSKIELQKIDIKKMPKIAKKSDVADQDKKSTTSNTSDKDKNETNASTTEENPQSSLSSSNNKGKFDLFGQIVGQKRKLPRIPVASNNESSSVATTDNSNNDTNTNSNNNNESTTANTSNTSSSKLTVYKEDTATVKKESNIKTEPIVKIESIEKNKSTDKDNKDTIKMARSESNEERTSSKRSLDFYSTLSKKIKLSSGASSVPGSITKSESSSGTNNKPNTDNPKKLVSILSNPNKPKKRKHVTFKPDGMLNNYFVFETEKEIDDRFDGDHKKRYGNARDMDRNEGYNAFSRIRNEMKQTIEYYCPKVMAIPVLEERATRSQEKEIQKEYESTKNEIFYLSESLIPESPEEPDENSEINKIELKPPAKTITQIVQLWNDECVQRIADRNAAKPPVNYNIRIIVNMLKAASQYFYLFPPYPLLFSIPNAQPILKNTDNYMFELLSTIAPNMSNSNFNDMMNNMNNGNNMMNQRMNWNNNNNSNNGNNRFNNQNIINNIMMFMNNMNMNNMNNMNLNMMNMNSNMGNMNNMNMNMMNMNSNMGNMNMMNMNNNMNMNMMSNNMNMNQMNNMNKMNNNNNNNKGGFNKNFNNNNSNNNNNRRQNRRW